MWGNKVLFYLNNMKVTDLSIKEAIQLNTKDQRSIYPPWKASRKSRNKPWKFSKAKAYKEVKMQN